MRQLFPEPLPHVDVVATYLADRREPVNGRPWLAVNMATTADGATALGGRSRGIGGPADRTVFQALRSAADIVLVGAGTARAENYGPVNVPDEHRAARAAAGRTGPARLAVISASGSLDPGARLFDADEPPLVYTVSETPAPVLAALDDVAEVVVAGTSSVDPGMVLADLARRSVRCVVCEGGPHLNASLIAADVIDEWCWTIGPSLVGGTSHRASVGPEPPGARPFRLDRLVTDGHDLVTRYLAVRDSPAGATGSDQPAEVG